VGDCRSLQHHRSQRSARHGERGVTGGRQTIYTLALNWYVNRNVRFLFDYLHGNIAKQVSPTNFSDAGAKFDAFAMRTQVAF